jgi:hypothetical protein
MCIQSIEIIGTNTKSYVFITKGEISKRKIMYYCWTPKTMGRNNTTEHPKVQNNTRSPHCPKLIQIFFLVNPPGSVLRLRPKLGQKPWPSLCPSFSLLKHQESTRVFTRHFISVNIAPKKEERYYNYSLGIRGMLCLCGQNIPRSWEVGVTTLLLCAVIYACLGSWLCLSHAL